VSTIDDDILKLRASILKIREDSHLTMKGQEATNWRQHGEEHEACWSRVQQHCSQAVVPLLTMMEFEEDESDFYYSLVHYIEHYYEELGVGILIDHAADMLSRSPLLGTMLVGRHCMSERHLQELLLVAEKRSAAEKSVLAELFRLAGKKYSTNQIVVDNAALAIARLQSAS
jgi:hypothetical protein